MDATPRGLITANRTIKRRQKPPYTGILLKAIYLDEAKPRGLRAAVAAPADESDKLAHIDHAFRTRYAALDKFFGLKSSSTDIWEQRAKELIAHELNIAIDHPQWWRALASHLATAYIPGFSLAVPGQKKHGAPLEWDFWQLAQLFADIEYLKRKEHWSNEPMGADITIIGAMSAYDPKAGLPLAFAQFANPKNAHCVPMATL